MQLTPLPVKDGFGVESSGMRLEDVDISLNSSHAETGDPLKRSQILSKKDRPLT